MQQHQETLSPDPDHHHLAALTQRECVEACVEAEVVCVACADACLTEEDIAGLRRCIRINLDCADVAGATARMLARRLSDARLLRAQVEACARACAVCAESCQEHANVHEHCRICADACHRAAERCGAVLRELPDAWGQTHPKAPSAE
jgi:hypothetical protein